MPRAHSPGKPAPARSRIESRKRWRRSQLLKGLRELEPCVVVMEACGTAHHWGREIRKLGHEVLLIAAHRVSPYRHGQKNDATDAMAILEASYRADLKPVAVKSEAQQRLQSVYVVRRRLLSHRTALSNQIRGLLAEFGYVLPKGLGVVRRRLPELIEQLHPELARLMRSEYEELSDLDARIDAVTRQLEEMAAANDGCRRLMKLPGIGAITAALLVAHCCPAAYRNGRNYSAVLGLVPRQHSSGDRVRLSRITRTGRINPQTGT